MLIRFTALVLALILSACAAESLKPLSPEKATGQTMLVLPVKLSAQSGKTEKCSLVLEQQDSGKHFEVEIADILYLPVPAGTLRVDELLCVGKRWNLDFAELPLLHIQPGRWNFASPLEFMIMDTIGSIRIIPQGTKLSAKILGTALASLPAPEQERAVTAYTGAKLTPLLLADNPIPSWFAYEGSAKTPLDRAPRPPAPGRCYEMEKKQNSLFLGTFVLESVYADRKNLSSKRVRDQSTYSDAFKSCVEELFKGFRPHSPKKIRYVFTL